MRVYTTIIRRFVSSKKFYDIVKERKDRIIPKTAEEVIISKYLKENATFIRNSMEGEAKKVEKQDNKTIPYQQFIRENPSGSIIQLDYKNTHLKMVSLNYQNISLPDVHQLCEKANPDLVFIQSRPESYIKSFQLLPKVNNCFSDLIYFEQLCLSPRSITSSFLTPQLTQKLEGMLGTGSNKKSDQKVFIHDNKDLVDDDVVMMASHYCSSKRKTLLFGELPEQPWREWLCNSHTLMELQEIFKYICKNIPFYQSLKLSPYRLAALLRPQLFLNLRDRYMGTIIEMAIASQKYPNILCFMGVTENQAVQQLLANGLLMRGEGDQSEFTPVIEYLIGPEIKHSLLGNTEGWQIIEKHIIMDLLHHGEAVLSQPLESFLITNKIIDYYGRVLNEYPEETILQFRYEKTLSYLSLMKEKVAQGEQLKRKFMLREALRSPSLDI